MNTTDTFEAFWETQCRSLPVENPKELVRALYERFRAELDAMTASRNKAILELCDYALGDGEREKCDKQIAALRAELETVRREREWTYCPECGSEEIHYEEGKHKQCAKCFQEWFSDLDYLGTVRHNLSALRAQLAAAQERGDTLKGYIQGCTDIIPDDKTGVFAGRIANLKHRLEQAEACVRDANILLGEEWRRSVAAVNGDPEKAREHRIAALVADLEECKEAREQAEAEAGRLRDEMASERNLGDLLASALLGESSAEKALNAYADSLRDDSEIRAKIAALALSEQSADIHAPTARNEFNQRAIEAFSKNQKEVQP